MNSEAEPTMTEQEKEEYFRYLDALRRSAVTNMFGAGPYLQMEFGLDKKEARAVVKEWMETFSERHPR